MTSLIDYQIYLSKPHAHVLEVVLTVPSPDPAGQRLSLPTWIPGSYLIREFARQIIEVSAVDASGEPVAVTKCDKSTWQLSPVSGPVRVSYSVYAFDESVRTAYFDMDRAFINPAAVCLSVVGQTDSAVTLTVVPTEAVRTSDWQLATGLPRVDGTADQWGFSALMADNYDHLIDCPIECGELEILPFDACATPHYLVLSGGHYGDSERLVRDTQAICETQIRFFAEDASKATAPYDRYVFLLYLSHDGYGGLEHRNSTALIASRADMPAKDGDTPPGAGYQQLLGLISHEYFHNWNVKRLKPAAYAPYDLSKEAYSRLLWAFEGVTSYYDDLMLVRAGVITEGQYLETLGKNLTATLRSPGARRQTLEDASLDAWIKYYRQDENSPNVLASYYVKGGVFACLLDLTLRQQYGLSLDHIMQALWQRVGKQFDTTGKGLAESEWESTVLEIAGETLKPFFDEHLRTPSDLITPLLSILPSFGVATQLRISEHMADKGGKWLDSIKAVQPALGLRLSADPMGAKVQGVVTDGAGERAGLHVGDVLIAIDGIKVVHAQIESLLARYTLGTKLTIHAFRKERLKTLVLELVAAKEDTIGLKVYEETHDKRRHWLTAC